MSHPPEVPSQGVGEPASDLAAPTDLELVDAARAGDGDASAELFRRHAAAAHRFARQLTGNDVDADDLVSEAFARVLASLSDGKGPMLAFRPYVLTTVRRLHVSGRTAGSREHTVAELDPYAIPEPATDRPLAEFESNAAVMAFASLPERWQVVLWQTEVERQKPAAVAAELGMSAGAVSALALRAREGLRQAWLQQHLADAEVPPACRETRQNLGGYVRGGLGARMKTKVHEHLNECGSCTALYLELMAENSWLPAVIAPALLGVFAGGYIVKAGLFAGGASGLHGVASHAGSSLSRLARSAGAGGTVIAGVLAVAVAAAAAGLWATGSFGANHHQVVSGPNVTTPAPTAPAAVHRAAPQAKKHASTKPPARLRPKPRPSKPHSVRARAAGPVATASPSPSPSRAVPLPPTSPKPKASSQPTASPTPRSTPSTPPTPPRPSPSRTARPTASTTPSAPPAPQTSSTPSPAPTATATSSPTPSRTPSQTPRPTATPTPTPSQVPAKVSVSAIGQPNAAAIIQVGVDRPAVVDLEFGPASIAVLTLSGNCTPAGPATSFTCHYEDAPGISQFVAAGRHGGQGVLVSASTGGTTTKYQCRNFELGRLVPCSTRGTNG